MKVLRAMKARDRDGLPETGATGRYLGVRANRDILVNDGGTVDPETGGMSVVPPPPENLAKHRRPPSFGGTGKDPVYELETDELPEDLAHRPDPANPERHGFIEPARRMSFGEDEAAIHGPAPCGVGFAGTYDNGGTMEQPKLDVAERVADLAMAEPYERALPTIRGYAAALLDTGYPRDTLYADFERARGVLSRRRASEEAEDTGLDVMDCLTGFSPSFMIL